MVLVVEGILRAQLGLKEPNAEGPHELFASEGRAPQGSRRKTPKASSLADEGIPDYLKGSISSAVTEEGLKIHVVWFLGPHPESYNIWTLWVLCACIYIYTQPS